MKAYVFSIGEPTTDLCVELMKEMGFEVVLYQDDTSLAKKLDRFYAEALNTNDDRWLRVDADIIPNFNVLKLVEINKGFGSFPSWVCASGFDWYKQDRGAISIHVMNREAVQRAYKYSSLALNEVRPETYIWRQPDVNFFTLVVENFNAGIHGYGQKQHRDRIKLLKQSRKQSYNWELVEKIEAL